MSDHQDDVRLNEYLDGTLPPESKREVELHIGECSACRRALEGLRALLADAAVLPRSIQPPRDLWPDVTARLERASFTRRSVWSMRYVLAAAAVLLITISSAITQLMVARFNRDGAGAPGMVGTEPSAASILARWQGAETQYLRATAELQETLEAAKRSLEPETVARIENNLRIIDAAIQESRAALAIRPHDREVARMLLATYEKKLEVLQQVTRLSSRI